MFIRAAPPRWKWDTLTMHAGGVPNHTHAGGVVLTRWNRDTPMKLAKNDVDLPGRRSINDVELTSSSQLVTSDVGRWMHQRASPAPSNTPFHAW